MRLHEYQSKMIFARYGIPVPKGKIASTATEARHVAEELASRVVIKAQVLVGGRGREGGIRLARTPREAEEVAGQILAMDIKGYPVRKVLVDEAVNIAQELYLAVAIERQSSQPVLIASAAGGMDIEEVARQSPEKINIIRIDPLLGLREYQARDIAVAIDISKAHWKAFLVIALNLWRVFAENDAILAEINPLVISADQRLLSLDGKMIVDDGALFRHPEIVEMRDLDTETPAESLARKYELSFIQLDGQIGCMVNGAGLAMTTMDLIKMCGGDAANFMDIGGGASAEKVAAGLRIVLMDPHLRVVLVNIFGGITRCDEVARGLMTAIHEIQPQVPIVVRLAGTNAAEGLRLLQGEHIITVSSLLEAANQAAILARGGQ